MIGILGDRVDRLQELVRAPVGDRGEVRALGPAPAVGQVPVDPLAEVFVAASCAAEICPTSATIFGGKIKIWAPMTLIFGTKRIFIEVDIW